MSESEAHAQAFFSGFCFSDGRGMLERPLGPWTHLALCGFGPIPLVFRQSVGWEDSFSGLLPEVSHQKRNSKAEPWGRVKGHPELWLKIGA